MKQYLMLCDENAMQVLRQVLGNIQFLEVEGMPMQGNKHNLLVTPIPPMLPVVSQEEDTTTECSQES